MTRARSKGVFAGILGGLAGRGFSLVAPLIVMPAMLNYLGASSFGIWMTAVSLTSMAMFVDFGIGNGLLTRLSISFGSADYSSMRRYIASAYAALSAIAVVILILFAATLYAVQCGWLEKVGLRINSDSLKIFVVCLVSFIVGIPISVIQRVMYACQRAWLSNIWQIAGACFSVVFCLVGIKLSLRPWEVIGAYSAFPLFAMLVSAIWFYRKNPEFRPGISDVSGGHAADLLKIGKNFFLLSVMTSVALNVDNMIVAHKLGAQAVMEYAVPAKLVSLLSLVVTTLFMPLWAANGEALAKKDYVWVRRTTLRMSLYGGIAVFAAGGGLVVLGGPILRVWMGRDFGDQTELLLFLSLLPFFMAITSPFNMILNGLGIVRLQVLAWFMFLALSVPIKWFALSEGNLWVIPATSAIVYFLTISISVCVYIYRNIPGFGVFSMTRFVDGVERS